MLKVLLTARQPYLLINYIKYNVKHHAASPGCQNVSMINLAVINSILSFLGILRGIGIFHPTLFVDDLVSYRANPTCVWFEVILNTFGFAKSRPEFLFPNSKVLLI